MLDGNTQSELDNDPVDLNEFYGGIIQSLPVGTAEVRYERIVYQNTVAALIAGAELTARDGVKKYKLMHTENMSPLEVRREASILASYVVG
jgi:hypothetical protein